ncbi:MAG: NfeD family protein [Desulfobacteraceae bacterium]
MHADLWWVWMVLAGIFLVGELFTAGFFLLWFAIGAAVAGLLAWWGPGLAWQILTFALVTGILLAFSRQLADKISKKQPSDIGADRFTGQYGIVTEEIDNLRNTGKVRVKQDEWRADSATGENIALDTLVKVVRLEGTHLVVRPNSKGDRNGS